MPTITLKHEINCDVDTFWKLFIDKEFNDRLYLDRLEFPEFKVLEQNETETRITRKVVGQPKMNMPAPVAKLFGSNFRYTEDGYLDKATKVWHWDMTPSALTGKMTNKGTVRVEPLGENKVRRVAEITIEARVFAVGGLIESSAEKQFRDGWDKSAAFLNEWIASHKSLSERGGPHRVVIVGAGFGGLNAAKGLARAPVEITILDRKNHHTFQPLLYQVATAGLNPADIAAPIRHILRQQANAEVLLADVQTVDVDRKRVVYDGGEIGYDTLILASGATHSYFGHDAWEEHAPGLKTLEDALRIRKKVFFAYEAAEREPDPEGRKAWLTFVVVGAGPTGVELAGVLVEIAQKTLARDFRRIDPREARVVLLEAGPDVLPAYVESLRKKALAQLEHLGCDIRTNARVTNITANEVLIGDERIASRTVLWAAGVAASAVAKSLGVPLDRAGRVIVEADLSIPGHPEVFVIGDLASFTQAGSPVPGVAPAAIQEGKHTAENVKRTLRGAPRLPFHYWDKGSLATIGRAAAIADFGKLKFSGFFAWIAWFLIHIFFLIGFRNRFLVMFEWALSYLTYQRGARLITGDTPPLLDAPKKELARAEAQDQPQP